MIDAKNSFRASGLAHPLTAQEIAKLRKARPSDRPPTTHASGQPVSATIVAMTGWPPVPLTCTRDGVVEAVLVTVIVAFFAPTLVGWNRSGT